MVNRGGIATEATTSYAALVLSSLEHGYQYSKLAFVPKKIES